METPEMRVRGAQGVRLYGRVGVIIEGKVPMRRVRFLETPEPANSTVREVIVESMTVSILRETYRRCGR